MSRKRKNPTIGIYSITNTINGKKIIGQSVDILRRWADHKYDLKRNIHANQHLQSAWNKYGEQSFKFEVILLCSIENLNREEIRLISENKTTDRNVGYNIDSGGKRNIVSEETKEKLRAYCGPRHWFFGGHLSDEAKQKLKEANTGKNHYHFGRPLSQEQRDKISKTNKNKTFSEETRQKISLGKIGVNNPNFGKKFSEETKAKMRESAKKAWAARKDAHLTRLETTTSIIP